MHLPKNSRGNHRGLYAERHQAVVVMLALAFSGLEAANPKPLVFATSGRWAGQASAETDAGRTATASAAVETSTAGVGWGRSGLRSPFPAL